MPKVERHAEIVRQWKVIRTLESRARGVTLAALRDAVGGEVTERTIRRDLDALSQAGFLIDVRKRDDGKTLYKLDREGFGLLKDTGLTLEELSALYFSRSLLAAVAPGVFAASLENALEKLTECLPQRLWQFLEQLPEALAAKKVARTQGSGQTRDDAKTIEAALVQAILDRRTVDLRYHSFSSRRVRDYALEPYRLVWAQGALYLSAFVPAYAQMRTFALSRIKALAVRAETFSPVAGRGDEPFGHSLGAFDGAPERVEIDFGPGVAPYVRERQWHPSQAIADLPDGGVRLALSVCVDWTLQAWVMGFGPQARVVAPPRLAAQILEDAEELRELYAPRMPLEVPPPPSPTPGRQRLLEFPPPARRPRRVRAG
jgi:predicted DNA-binding transcriptional regulator YafY